jgi:hypothetical protein
MMSVQAFVNMRGDLDAPESVVRLEADDNVARKVEILF